MAEAGNVVHEDDRKLFVGALPQEAKDTDIKEYFGTFGDIENINLKMDPMTGRSRGFAFIVFKELAGIEAALAQTAHVVKGKKQRCRSTLQIPRTSHPCSIKVIIIAQQIAQGMGYLHHKGIIHKVIRELKVHQQQSEDLHFTRASDIYAFGTVWYELLTGEWPWKEQPPEAIIWQVRFPFPFAQHLHSVLAGGLSSSSLLSSSSASS